MRLKILDGRCFCVKGKTTWSGVFKDLRWKSSYHQGISCARHQRPRSTPLSLPPSLAWSELQAVELTAIVQQNSLLCGMVFFSGYWNINDLSCLSKKQALFCRILKSSQLHWHPPFLLCFTVIQNPLKIYLVLSGEVRAQKRNVYVPYVWLQMENGNVEGHEGRMLILWTAVLLIASVWILAFPFISSVTIS